MFTLKHVVAAVDFSPATEPLLDCLAELKSAGMETVTLVYVLEVHYGRRPPAEHQEMYQEKLDTYAEQLRGHGFTVHTQLSTGHPAPRIVQHAEEKAADLILLASRGHNLLYRMLLGSTAAEVIRTATVPVLLDRIEPTDESDGLSCAGVCGEKFRNPLLATDLSSSAEGAEQAAVALSRQADSAVFMTVRDTGDSSVSADAAREQLQALADQSTCPTTVRVEHNSKASDAIVAAAEAEDSTLLIVGKHGRGYVEGQLVGSTAGALAKRSRRSVLMVPTPVEA